jgi:hypothetical protein
MSQRPLTRRLACLTSVVALSLLGLTGCEPLKNAPPGGGDTVTETFRYGPFTLGPGGEVQGSPASGLPRPAGSFGLKYAKFDVVDSNGTPVSVHDVHLHHIVMTTSAREDLLCPGRRERFIGSGMERTPISILGPYAYLVGANDQWGAIYHLMNETQTTRTVYIQYTLQYQPGANSTNSRPVQPLFMDVTGCGDSTYDIPGNGGPGSVNTKSRTWAAQRDGIAVFAGGHLHDGGIDITLKDDTTGLPFCVGKATYHENPHHLATINGCVLHHKVTAGHDYTVSARYDNSQPYDDVMGIYLSYVWWGTQ